MGLTPTRVLFTAAATNCALLLVGVIIAPATLGTLAGVGEVVADLGLQVSIAVIGWRGPLSLSRLGQWGSWCLAVGGAFALVYVVHVLLDFAGHPLQLNPYLFFFTAAVAGSAPVALRVRRVTRAAFAAAWSLVLGTAMWSSGLLIIAYAYWGTPGAHGFWLRDGALGDFRHSGTKSLSVFIQQDLQGALFFHPFLSAFIGAAGGFTTAAAVLAGSSVRRRVAS